MDLHRRRSILFLIFVVAFFLFRRTKSSLIAHSKPRFVGNKMKATESEFEIDERDKVNIKSKGRSNDLSI